MSSQYVILKFKSLFYNNNFVQIAVYSYDTDEDKPEVYLAFIEGWGRTNTTVNEDNPLFESLLGDFLRKTNTKTLLQAAIDSTGPYSVFEFGEPNDSLSPAETLAQEVASGLLVE